MDCIELHREIVEIARHKMAEHLKHVVWTHEQLHTYQEFALRKLLTHAKETTAYYAKTLTDINVESLKLTQLSSLPVTTKDDTLKYWNSFVSNGIMSRIQAEEHLKKLRSGEVDNPVYNDNYLIFATGGSSGKRGLFVWSLEDFADFMCVTFRHQVFDESKEIQVPKKIAVIVASSWLHGSYPLFSATFNNADKVKHFSIEMSEDELIRKLNEFQPTQLIGFSSMIVRLSKLALSGPLKIMPTRVSTNSEPLDDEARKSIFEAWSVKVNNMWGSIEAGIMGVENDQHQGLLITDDYCLIEMVDNDLRPVTEASKVKKLLITNLINYTFPLIRYVVDDVTFLKKTDDSIFRISDNIDGRSDDWFSYQEGVNIHPMVFRDILGQIDDILEYQVEQIQSGVIVRVVSNNMGLSVDSVQEQVANAVEKCGIINPTVHVEKLKAIPRHAESGKMKRFIPIG